MFQFVKCEAIFNRKKKKITYKRNSKGPKIDSCGTPH